MTAGNRNATVMDTSAANENAMASITVKNIPDDLLERLRRAAARDNRSINRQIIEYLERQLRPRKLDVDATLARARELRGRVLTQVSMEEIDAARRDGRP